jgi:hypothetical protein
MAFLPSSRYAKIETVETTASGGRPVTAVKLRRLPQTEGVPHTVEDRDRLDILAFERLGDATRFWSIADANTELEAESLTDGAGETLNLPTT